MSLLFIKKLTEVYTMKNTNFVSDFVAVSAVSDIYNSMRSDAKRMEQNISFYRAAFIEANKKRDSALVKIDQSQLGETELRIEPELTSHFQKNK
jgi:hypothetical protein